MLVWLLLFWAQWIAVCSLDLPIPLGSNQGAPVSVCFNYCRGGLWKLCKAQLQQLVLMMPVLRVKEALCVW